MSFKIFRLCSKAMEISQNESARSIQTGKGEILTIVEKRDIKVLAHNRMKFRETQNKSSEDSTP